ncbi:MAG TPA: hypothetical protein VGP08_24970 [Pyrinomonadaceae bacterium]|nr:hypothetical protein [Pyrinomonadaceae bacterium]
MASQDDALAALSEELPPLRIHPTSFDARIAGIEPCSVIRELSKHHASIAAFEVEQAELRGEVRTDEEGDRLFRDRWERQWERKPKDLDDYIESIKARAMRFINWGDIGRVWNASPPEAIELWRAIRLEARDEFISGHYGARSFEVMSWQHDAFRRAQYLAIRDGLVEEWRPRAASEFMLIDQMTQCYVMQLEWTEKAMIRLHGEPRMESWEYRQWKERRKVEERVNQWGPGSWDIPYQQEAEAVEQAFRMADLCMKSFQRAARQLANIRLVRAKTARVRRRDRAKTIRGVRVA